MVNTNILIDKGTKVIFNNNFKQKIVDHPSRDVLFYIKDDVFEVNEIKGDKISLYGIDLLGFLPLSIFETI